MKKRTLLFIAGLLILSALAVFTACKSGDRGNTEVSGSGTAAGTDTENVKEKEYISVEDVKTTYPYRADENIAISMTVTDEAGILTAGNNRVEFRKHEDGAFRLTTYIRKDGEWIAFFDAGTPLLQGIDFGVDPTELRAVSDTDSVKSFVLTGKHPKLGYGFTVTAEAYIGNPLIHFTVSCDVGGMTMQGKEPTVMLWKKGTFKDKVSVNQETPNYQTVEDSVYWYSGFPASYLYTGGVASAVYFDMTNADWFSVGGISRFNAYQVRCTEKEGKTGIGLDLRLPLNNKRSNSDSIDIEFYLWADAVDEKPTKLDALDTEVEAFGYCLASSSGSITNYVDGIVSYEHYTEKIVEGLAAEGVTYSWNGLRMGTGWTDGPLITGYNVTRLLNRNGYVSVRGDTVSHSGDWNCNNNCLIPWILYDRLHPEGTYTALIREARTGLLAYFDNTAKMYRSFDVFDSYAGSGKEFTFQNYTMGYCSLWASEFADNADFIPALGGKFIISMDGYAELAHNNNYLQPQLIDVANKTTAVSIDETSLGKINEAWSGGFYAYSMCYAYDLTGKTEYLEEAKKQMDTLFGGLTYYVNDLKEKLYSDPYEFPVNEVNSVAFGVAACQWLYRITGEKKYDDYADSIRNLTLRMMQWYESSVPGDKTDEALSSISFFNAFSKTGTTCPWEAIQTYLPFLMELKNTDDTVSQAVLKAFNLFRQNAYSFSGASWDPTAVPGAAEWQKSVTAFFTPEGYYSVEIPTQPAANGANTYMTCSIMYAYLMYEAYGTADNGDMMLVNLDLVDNGWKMANGTERNFLAFNPTASTGTFRVLFRDLHDDCRYKVTVRHEDGRVITGSYTGSQLSEGALSLKLQGVRYCNITVSLDENEAVYKELMTVREAQLSLMKVYAAVQGTALSGVTNTRLMMGQKSYEAALAQYNSGDYAGCIATLADTVANYYGN